MRQVIAIVVIFLTPLLLAEYASSEDASAEQSALEFQTARFKAMVDEDMKSLEGFLADDLNYSYTTGWTETKSGFLSTVESRSIDYVSMIPEDVEYGSMAT